MKKGGAKGSPREEVTPESISENQSETELNVPTLVRCRVSEAALLGGHGGRTIGSAAAGRIPKHAIDPSGECHVAGIRARSLNVEIGMVEDVIELRTYLQADPLGKFEVLVEA